MQATAAPRSLFQPVAKTRKRANILVYGGMGRGKSYFALSFSKLGRVAVIDLEGRLSDYQDRFAFDILPARDLPTILAGIEEVRRDNGKTWTTLVIDPITILWGTLQDAMQQVMEQKSIAAKRNLAVDEAAAEAGFTQLEWQKIKRQFRRVLHALASLKVNVIVTAYERSPKDQPTVFDPDCDKRTPHAFSTVLHFHSETAHTARVMKDSTGLFKLGAVVTPDAELFRAYVSGQEGMVETVDAATDEEAAIRATAQMFNETATQSDATPQSRAPTTPTSFRPQTASESPPTATDRQIASIRKLSVALGRGEPDTKNMTFAVAHDMLTQLSQAYSDARKRDDDAATPATTPQPKPLSQKVKELRDRFGINEETFKRIHTYWQWGIAPENWPKFLKLGEHEDGQNFLRVAVWAEAQGVTLGEIGAAMPRCGVSESGAAKWTRFWAMLQSPDNDILADIEAQRPRPTNVA